MTKIEWNKFFAWLVAIYPQWKPEPAVSATWYDELGRIGKTVEDLKSAIRKINAANPSPFPAGVFQIVAALADDFGTAPRVDAQRAWAMARLCARGGLSWAKAFAETPGLAETVRLIGGRDEIGMATDASRPFVEKRFIEIFSGIKTENRINRNDSKLLTSGFSSFRQIAAEAVKP